MLLKCFGSPIIGFERADFPMSGHVHDADRLGRCRRLPRDRRADRSPDPSHDNLDALVACWRLNASHAVRVPDAGASAG
jgi:hypothetical protein